MDYLHLLEDWKVRYAPKTPEDALDDRFVEVCQMHCHIEYLSLIHISAAFYFVGSIIENSEPLPGSETTLI